MSSAENTDDETIFRETTERFWLLRLVTEVRGDGVNVRLHPVQCSFRRIPAAQIRDVNATSYAGTAYGGWHWGVRRTPNGNTVYRLRGGQGVEVERTNGERWFIGSQRPTELQSAIERICTPDEF
ncbi:hypothetical protein [Halostella sp. PRR32]|uniref:hypothetical protein n=1 Tax=Halostella sp. PRR32 TaxID=3098147 RepID=UPI002B1E47A3|nr:hypothetical protein [Halostella sp. PRR32]